MDYTIQQEKQCCQPGPTARSDGGNPTSYNSNRNPTQLLLYGCGGRICNQLWRGACCTWLVGSESCKSGTFSFKGLGKSGHTMERMSCISPAVDYCNYHGRHRICGGLSPNRTRRWNWGTRVAERYQWIYLKEYIVDGHFVDM